MPKKLSIANLVTLTPPLVIVGPTMSKQIQMIKCNCEETCKSYRLTIGSGGMYDKEEAERIVTCVNALAGIEDVEGFMHAVKDIVGSDDYSCYCHSGTQCTVHVLKEALFPKGSTDE